MKAGLTIIPVSHVSEVLKLALVRQPEPIVWDEEAEEAAAAAKALVVAPDTPGATAH